MIFLKRYIKYIKCLVYKDDSKYDEYSRQTKFAWGLFNLYISFEKYKRIHDVNGKYDSIIIRNIRYQIEYVYAVNYRCRDEDGCECKKIKNDLKLGKKIFNNNEIYTRITEFLNIYDNTYELDSQRITKYMINKNRSGQGYNMIYNKENGPECILMTNPENEYIDI